MSTVLRANRSFLSYAVNYAVAAVLVGFAPFLLGGQHLGDIGRRMLLGAGVLVAAFVVSAGLVAIILSIRKRLSVQGLLAIVFSVYAAALFAVVATDPGMPATLAGAFIGCGLLLLVLPLVFAGTWPIAVQAVAAIAVVALLLPEMRQLAGRAGAGAAAVQTVNIETQLHDIQATYFRGFLPRERRGGAIAGSGDALLLVLGTGDLYRLQVDVRGPRLTAEPLDIPSPLNDAAFDADAPPGVDRLKFRVNDLFVRTRASGTDVFLSHHFWYADRACFVLRLSRTTLDENAGPAERGWQTVYETSPCLPLKETGHPFAGHQAGGRIEQGADGRLLMTVGDYEFDGHSVDLDLPQDPDSPYGKILEIDTDSGEARVVSLGHRNPQGLLADSAGRLWSTEHGPRGGDELNLIEEGRNYGWPLVTYGISYGGPTWPLNPAQGRHDGYEEPKFAWVPSVGISSLIEVRGDRFPSWTGDLLVSSMRANTLFRMRVVDDRVIFSEPFDVGTRVRDLVQRDDGSIVLWTDRAEIVVLTTASGPTSMSAFSRYCGGCHAIADGTRHGIGPDLAGIGGADAAAAPGFEYSGALRRSGLTWDKDTLDRYLRNPQEFVPGTTMSFPGILDETERAAVVDHVIR